jgi:hypothetical protein
MTRDEVIAILTPLAVALAPAGRFEDAAEFNIYTKALIDLPVELLRRAADRAARTRTFMPKPGELRADAEVERRAWLALEAWSACAQCRDSGGWIEQPDGRVARCVCWRAHMEKIAQLGLTTVVVERPALPPAQPEYDGDAA